MKFSKTINVAFLCIIPLLNVAYADGKETKADEPTVLQTESKMRSSFHDTFNLWRNNRFFEDNFPHFGVINMQSSCSFGALDVIEKNDKIEINVELPGVNKKEIEVSVFDNLIVIKGEKKQTEFAKGIHYSVNERYFGSFERSIRIPRNFDKNKVTSNFKDGVLKINVPTLSAEGKDFKKIRIDD